jgi:hypothetical protein
LRAAAWLVAAGALALGGSADAYVRSRTQHGTAVYWPGGCAFVQPDSGVPADAPPNTFDIIQKSMNNWQSVTLSCGYLQLKYDAPAPLEAHLDGRNVVKFRTDKWCHPDDAQNKGVCYEKAAAAITTVFYLDRPGSSQDGFIIDADVELNDLYFTFVDILVGQPVPAPRSGTTVADLENTLTHELGHLQGLDHTCKDAATPSNAVDENGNPPPPCPALDNPTVFEATMYNSAQPGETKKRTPEADDIAGICAAYPLDKASHHASCEHTNLGDYDTRACGVLPHPPSRPFGGALVLLAAAAGALALRRRRPATRR